MKELIDAERNVKAARQRLRLLLAEVEWILSNRIGHCGCLVEDLCGDCKWSKKLIAKAQDMRGDK